MCYLIPLIVGLISAILGYLIGKMNSGGNQLDFESKINHLTSENETLNNQLYLAQRESKPDESQIRALQVALENCNRSKANLETEIEQLKTKTLENNSTLSFASTAPSYPAFDAEQALAIMGKKIIEDDLKIIEGIGPKIEELYHNAGIKTWNALANTPIEKSKEILHEAGPRFTVHSPETWSKQALLAVTGQWEELKNYQDALNGGKE
ncbi:hypothetical protein [Flavobacterium sp.]|uniref:hypothetical protein n=1 Tax=Flavobacterium sp. TaxID=239 RepID=UPI003D1239A6